LVNKLYLIKDNLVKINYTGKKLLMPRPNKILEPTKTYNLLMKEEQYDRLAYIAHQMQKTKLEQVAVADLIRDAIDIYLEVLEEEHETESKD
tara:strand:+ start:2080 stop:2355 length:276 start_codon:yes stop_codon:yes gene_type:complete